LRPPTLCWIAAPGSERRPTNNWAADSIGKITQLRFSGGMSEQVERWR
jgi:hypothetical protein